MHAGDKAYCKNDIFNKITKQTHFKKDTIYFVNKLPNEKTICLRNDFDVIVNFSIDRFNNNFYTENEKTLKNLNILKKDKFFWRVNPDSYYLINDFFRQNFDSSYFFRKYCFEKGLYVYTYDDFFGMMEINFNDTVYVSAKQTLENFGFIYQGELSIKTIRTKKLEKLKN
jgi:hypothetical protein